MPQETRLADRVVAIINDEPILLSEVGQNTLEGIERDGAIPEQLRGRLEGMINQVLILQEVRRLRIFTVNESELAELKENMSQRAGGTESIIADMRERKMTEAEYDAFLYRYLLISKFIDFRFRRPVDIDEQELQNYYNDQFLPQFRIDNPDAPIPTFESRRTLILRLLTEQHVNQALEQWLDNARDRARIVIKF